jgi:Predicted metal-binding, possibly nucleic acid-binding protein
MKWTIQHLNRYQFDSLKFETTLSDFNERFSHPDITQIEDVNVEGRMIIRDAKYIFQLFIETVIHMQCALTLVDVPVAIQLDVEEIFSDDPADHLILGNDIDLYPIVWMNIVAEKPMRVIADGAQRQFVEAKEPSKQHPGLKGLEKFK